jgi:hypothetical protein
METAPTDFIGELSEDGEVLLMTRRLLLSRWTRRFAVLLIIVSALAPVAFVPFALHAQSGITSPTSGTTVSGDVIITGTAVHPAFQRYELYYKLEPSSNDAYIYFDGGSAQVTNGPLGIWRTATLPPGVYTIRLRVVKNDSNYDEAFLENVLIGQAASAEATPTPTPTASEPTPTPIPTATFTPAPQPTPNVGQVTQPQVEGDGPVLAPTLAVDTAVLTGTTGSTNDASGANAGTLFADAAPAVQVQEVNTSFTRDLGEAVAVDRLRGFFFTGMRASAILILGSIVLLAGRRLVSWVWTQYR